MTGFFRVTECFGPRSLSLSCCRTQARGRPQGCGGAAGPWSRAVASQPGRPVRKGSGARQADSGRGGWKERRQFVAGKGCVGMATTPKWNAEEMATPRVGPASMCPPALSHRGGVNKKKHKTIFFRIFVSSEKIPNLKTYRGTALTARGKDCVKVQSSQLQCVSIFTSDPRIWCLCIKEAK